jgi:hypothetical protein
MSKGNGNKFSINGNVGWQPAEQKQRGHRNKGIQTQFSNQQVVGEAAAIQDRSRYKNRGTIDGKERTEDIEVQEQ